MLAARARDLTPLLEVLQRELQDMIDHAWRSRRSPGGDRWPDTVRESESDGETRRTARVRVDGQSLVLEVGAEHASFVLFGTRHQPARNPLPVEPRGGQLAWMERGDAGAWLARLPQRIESYLTGGEEWAT